MYTLNKRSILDIVPLLDVILILLFVMMLNVGQSMIELENSASNLERKLVEAEENIQLIQEDLDESKKELLNEKMKTEQLITALSKIIKEDEEKIKNLLNDMQLSDQADLEDKLSDIVMKENLYDELIKYSIVSNKISFIDIYLKGEDNRLYINNEETSLFLHFEEVADFRKRISKKTEIKELIFEVMENSASSEISLITVKVDSDVDRIAYLLVQEVIDDIEVKYGSNKIIRTK